MRELLAEAVVDALSSNIAVLDEQGRIVGVNEAWKRFASANGCDDADFYVGQNYLSICDRAARSGACPSASSALVGIAGVLRGEQPLYELEYSCDSPSEQRWFLLRASRLSSGNLPRIAIAHDDVTARKKIEFALEESGRTLKQVLETLPIGVWIMDATGKIVHGNPASQLIWAGARYVGPEQFGEYKGWWVSSGKLIAADEWAATRAIRNGEVSIDEEIEIECFDGTHKIILNAAMPLRDEAGNIIGAIIVNQDITQRKENEQALRQTTMRLETLFSILPVGVSILNRNFEMVDMNAALGKMLLLAADDTRTRANPRREYVRRDGSRIPNELLPQHIAQGASRVVSDDVGVRLDSGQIIWTSVTAAPLPDSDGGVVVVSADITARVEAETALAQAKHEAEEANRELRKALARESLLARTDTLTGLKNRRHFFDIALHEFTVARRYSQELSIIVFDIDFFKKVNDSYGHAVGDEVLRIIAQIASAEVRESDLLARLGGEEFIVLLPSSGVGVAENVAERIRASIARFNWHDATSIESLTLSAGVAGANGSVDSLDRLIQRADQALYRAKAEGRNRVVVFESAFA